MPLLVTSWGYRWLGTAAGALSWGSPGSWEWGWMAVPRGRQRQEMAAESPDSARRLLPHSGDFNELGIQTWHRRQSQVQQQWRKSREQMGEKIRQCTWRDPLPWIPSVFTQCGGRIRMISLGYKNATVVVVSWLRNILKTGIRWLKKSKQG